MQERAARIRAQSGITLIEVCIVIAVAMVLLGNALPSFQDTLTRRSLEGHAAELAGDVQYLRSQVVASNRTLRMSFQSGSAGSCYVIHSGHAADCTCNAEGPAQCVAGAEPYKSVFLPASGRVRVKSKVQSMVFDPVLGTVSPASTLALIDDRGRAIHHVVNIMGRVSSCSPGGAIPGYKVCKSDA
jgi:type IV fimbrial biogenesis protein FimT